MVSKRIITGLVWVVGLMAGNLLHAQQDVLLPFMKTDHFEYGENVKEGDARFVVINKDMALYQPVKVPFKYLGLTITESLVSIENNFISRIVLFISEDESGKTALSALQVKLDKLTVTKGEDGVDRFWRSSKYEIVLQEGTGSDIIYLQPISGSSQEDGNPDKAD